MLRIGYVRLRDARSSEDTAVLKQLGCHVVRAEEPAAPGGDESAVLYSILDFIGEGDQLVVTRLDQLGHSTRNVLRVIDRLEARCASLFIVEPDLTTDGEGGRALRAALKAVAGGHPRPAAGWRESRGDRPTPGRLAYDRVAQAPGDGGLGRPKLD